jgi:DHA1 family inner membrane transport protein
MHSSHTYVGDLQSDGNGVPAQTSWLTVFLAFSAGIVAAFQIGKVHIGLPSIRQSYSLDLVSASWILSALNVVGLFTATPVGTFCARAGNKRSLVAGLAMIGAASALGGYSPSVAWLLISRLAEGIGFVIVIVAAPSLIVEVTSVADIRFALALWSSFLPGGVAIIAALAPAVLNQHTWRAVWWLNGLLLLILAILVALFSARGLPHSAGEANVWSEFRSVLTARGPLLLAIIFGMYTLQHLSIMGFMPTLLRERFQISEQLTGILASIAMASNVLGNLAAGVLLQRGVPRVRIIWATSLFMACVALVMLSVPIPFAAFYMCAVGFSCIGGLIPSAVIGAAPFYMPAPSLIGATNGLLVQGSNLGIVLGPPIVSSIATRFGWNWVPAATGGAAVVAILLALNLQSSTESRAWFLPENVVE